MAATVRFEAGHYPADREWGGTRGGTVIVLLGGLNP
jgi:hypothetical protein